MSNGTVGEDVGLGLFSVAAGCTDVLAFLKLGELFTSAMTGNTALLAIALGSRHLPAALRSMYALLGFAIGVVLATLASGPLCGREPDRRRLLRRLLPLELLFLGCCAGLWAANLESVHGRTLYAVISLSAVSMGIQAVAARASRSSGVNTIVFTTNLTNILIFATRALRRFPAAPTAAAHISSQVYAFAAYFGGAALAAVLASRSLRSAVWVPPASVLLAFGCLEFATPRSADG